MKSEFTRNLRITVDENTKVKDAFSDLERENRRLDHMLQDTRQEADTEIQAMRRRLHDQTEAMERERERELQAMRNEISDTRSALQEERRARTTEQQAPTSDPWAVASGHHPSQSPIYTGTHQSPPDPGPRQMSVAQPGNQCGRYDVPLPRQMLYDGKGSYETFIRPFINMAKVCKWSNEEKVFRLTNSLRGEAADYVFNQLDSGVRASYYDLQHALATRFKERRTTASFLVELESRKLGQKEKLIEYVADIKCLVRNSYPTADGVTLDTIGLRHFLRGICDQQMVLAVGMKNPQSIEEACDILGNVQKP